MDDKYLIFIRENSITKFDMYKIRKLVKAESFDISYSAMNKPDEFN